MKIGSKYYKIFNMKFKNYNKNEKESNFKTEIIS